jgi:REP element-mobilizing transposase RayT
MQSSEKPDHLVSGLHFRNVLPHLKREGGIYFITFRLAGTLPKNVLLWFKREREAIIEHARAARRPLTWHEQEALFRWYSSRVDKYLDEGRGNCWLRDKKCADLVAGAMCFFAHQRYELRAWVVMPNHVHAVVHPTPPNTLSEILHSWKSFTSHKIQEFLPRKIVPFWQDESYDHLVRNDDDLHRLCHYTTTNPVSAGLCSRPEEWLWSSAHRTIGNLSVPSKLRARQEKAKLSGETPLKPAGEDACAT